MELYAIADGQAPPGEGDPTVIFCMDEFGPLNLQPHPGRQWAPVGDHDPDRPRRRRRRATYKRPHGVRHLLAGYDLNTDRLYGHVKTTKGRTQFLEFCRYLRSLYPPEVRIAIVMDNFSPHLSTKTDSRVGDWAQANNVELAYVPTYASWLNRIWVNRPWEARLAAAVGGSTNRETSGFILNLERRLWRCVPWQCRGCVWMPLTRSSSERCWDSSVIGCCLTASGWPGR